MEQINENDPKKSAAKKPAPSPEAGAKDKKKKEKVKGKERKSNTFLLILIILILTSIIAIGAIFMFNFAGLKAETSMWISNLPVVGKLLRPVVESKNPEQIAKEEIELEKSKLAITAKELDDRAKELDKREKAVESKERELSDKELQINDKLQKLSSKLTSIEEQVKYLEKIDNAKAAQILLSMDDKDSVVQILRNMKKEKTSAVLALMDPLQAAQILEDLSEPTTTPTP